MTELKPNDQFHASSFLQGHNAEYIEQLYAQYANDPNAVDEAWQQFFRALGDAELDVKAEAHGPSWARRDWRLAFASLSVVLILLALGGRWGQKGLSLDRSDPSSFRLLQPNFDIALEWNRAEVQHNYDELFQMTGEACDSPSSLVVWPESAGWPYSYSRDESFRQDVESFALERCPVLLNSSIHVEAGDRNSVLLVTDSGVVGRYDKYHLVPFGEYVPLSRWLPFLRQIARNAGAFSAGENLDPLPWRGQQLAVAVCYEITFPEEVAKRVALGGTILVTVTNDAWYGDSSAPWQHFQAARFRAAENGRYLVRAALTGVSAVVNPDGSLDQILEVGERGMLSATVPNVRGRTPFSRLPWLVPALSWVMCLSAILLTFKDRD